MVLVAAEAQVQSLARELPHAEGAAEKKKKKNNSILKGDGPEMISLLAVQEKLTAKRQSSQSRDIK